MELFNFIFRLGVVFAIFGFLWGIIQIGYQLLRAGSVKSIAEDYVIKMIKYFFLVDVTFLFCTEDNDININQLIITALVLLTYFIGKLQNQQNRVESFKIIANGIAKNSIRFDIRAEIFVISFAILFFTGFTFYPQYASNPISIWFCESIDSINNAAFFGFIFKIIGFFFLINMIMKMVNAFSMILAGKPLTSRRSSGSKKDDSDRNNNRFDDYEEIE